MLRSSQVAEGQSRRSVTQQDLKTAAKCAIDAKEREKFDKISTCL